MPTTLILLALAPVVIIAVYIYVRDKYEHEPLSILITALIVGALICFPISYIEKFISSLWENKEPSLSNAAFTAFGVAAFTEEIFKFLALYLLIWKNRNFNEKFDGIVYAVFVSLGFAGIENILYVTNYGANIGYIRAFTAVPGHAFFGVAMGYYFGIAKFYPDKRRISLLLAFIIPFALHGIYDFILMSEYKYLMFIYVPFLILLWYMGLKQMKRLSEQSIFRNDGFGKQDTNLFGF